MPDESLWRCRKCGRRFANRNQTHTCAALHDLDHHFDGRDPIVRELFDLVVTAVHSIGPVTILPEKTRIAFQVRMSFAQVTPRKRWLDGHVVLARRLSTLGFEDRDVLAAESPARIPPERPGDVDATFVAWMREAYAVGAQRHLHMIP
jgi:hypothetical protein